MHTDPLFLVTFSVTEGGGALSTTKGAATASNTIQVLTGPDGTAQVWLRQGSAPKTLNTVTAQTGASVSFQSRTSAADGLWSEWKLNDAAGAVAAESTGMAPAGTLMSGATWNSGYNTKGGLELNGFSSQGGSNAYVTMGNPPDRSLDFGKGSFSISLWVRFSNTEIPPGHYGGRRLVTKGHHGWNPGYFIGVNGAGGIEAGVGAVTGGTAESTLIRTTSAFNDDKWHHVVFVNDSDEQINRIFVDGVAQQVTKEIGSGGTLVTGDPTTLDISALSHLSASREDLPLYLGSHLGIYDFFDGGVDEVRIYRKALGEQEIQTIRNSSADGNVLPDWWEMLYLGSIDQDPNADADGDGLSNLLEYQQRSNPSDYYSQGGTTITPRVSVYSGGNAKVEAGHYSIAPVIFKVVNAANGAPLVNAPVTVEISSGAGLLAASSSGDTHASIVLRTNAQGLVSSYFKAP